MEYEYLYALVLLIPIILLILRLLLFMYMEKLKKKRAAAARNQNIEGDGNENANRSATANRCRRNHQVSTISGNTEFEVVTSSSAPANPRDKFIDLPPTYDEAVKVHMSVFPSEPAPEYTVESSSPTESSETSQRV